MARLSCAMVGAVVLAGPERQRFSSTAAPAAGGWPWLRPHCGAVCVHPIPGHQRKGPPWTVLSRSQPGALAAQPPATGVTVTVIVLSIANTTLQNRDGLSSKEL